MSHILEIKKTVEGKILARRKDGQPLTPEDREEARRLASEANPQGAPTAFPDNPERLAAAVLADNSPADVERILAVWRRLFNMHLDPGRVRAQLAMLEKWHVGQSPRR